MVSELDGWLHTMPLHRVPSPSGRLGYRQAEGGRVENIISRPGHLLVKGLDQYEG